MHAVTLGSAEIVVEKLANPDRQAHAASQNDREPLLGCKHHFQSLLWGALAQPSLPARNTATGRGKYFIGRPL